MSEASQRHSAHDRPLITIIMAVYNAEKYVGEAIASVLAQTYDNWQLICVDDSSTDAARDIVSAYTEADERIKLFCNEKNMGAAATRNIAIEHAQGEFIAVLDADDVALPTRLEEGLLAFSEDATIGLVAGVCQVIGPQGEAVDQSFDPGQAQDDAQIRGRLMTRGPQFAHSSIMVRRELLELIGGYDEALPASHDYDMYLRLLPHCEFKKIGATLVNWRTHPCQLGYQEALTQKLYAQFARARAKASLEGRPFDAERELRRVRELIAGQRRLSRQAGRLACRLGWSAARREEWARARQLLGQAIRFWPLNAGAWLGFICTFAPKTVQRQVAAICNSLRQRLPAS